MSLIDITNLSFAYDGSYEPVFEKVSFQIDTDWKLGFIGRNGRGKTTFLNLLMGNYPYQGSISSSVSFDYFPFTIASKDEIAQTVIRNKIAPFTEWETQMELLLKDGSEQALETYGEILELYLQHDGYQINELIEKEARKLGVSPDTLLRPFHTLSNGEQTKLMLAGLFLKKNQFLLIDEPTNHLDREGREIVGNYLAAKKGFILVSHDRAFLDQVVDHVLSINLINIEIQKGNFTSWDENKRRQDQFELAEHEKLKRDVSRLTKAAARTERWSDHTEKTKYATRNSGLRPDRGFVGHKAAKMMKRSKTLEQRQQKAIEEKSELLKNIEQTDSLKIKQLPYPKETLLQCSDLSLFYGEKQISQNINLVLRQGNRIALQGANGCGKSTLLKLLMGETIRFQGFISVDSQLKISYVSQDTSFLKGSLKTFCEENELDESLVKTILRKLDFTRSQLERDMTDYSAGQKKKVLLARSLSERAHLYLWDEPLNYVDILSRIQLEELLLNYQPTMIFVEHDRMFQDKIATQVLKMQRTSF